MHTIIIASYLTTAAAFLAASVLLAFGWRRQRTGGLLILAAAVMVPWGAFLAWTELHQGVAIEWFLLADTLRYGAWITFIGALFAARPLTGSLRLLRSIALVTWVLEALYCLAAASDILRALHLPFSVNAGFIGVLVQALVGVVLLEQVYRNVDPGRRWALKFLIIGLGVMFAYDIFLYSYAVLYGQLALSAWAARGFIDALAAPLLVVAAARNREWKVDVGVSRNAVFHSTSLLIVAFYIIATAIGGYYVQLYGGDWGRVAEITLVCFALLAAVLLVTSGQARSRLRVFLQKNFFSYRHDYREEWLRLTTTLSANDDAADLSQRAARAIAQIMDSPAAALLLLADDAHILLPAASLNMSVPTDLKVSADLPLFAFMRERRWIYDLDAPPPLGEASLQAPAQLSGLPRAWLLVPLLLHERLLGVVVLAQARARRPLDWEDIDLLRTAGTQVASALAQAANARRLAEARQFEGFNRLTAFLMHDLKNVAGQQSLLLQNAERHKRNPAFVDDMLATVANSVRRIQHVLEQLRDGAAPAAPGRVQLQPVVVRALAECAAQLPLPDWNPPAQPVWVHADATQLATVLSHVIRNAQDAATARGHVTLRLTAEADSALLEIKDDGAGMDAEFVRTRLFQPFFTTKSSKGMGIGAYQAREYIRSLGGTVAVASSPGAGTVFALRIPIAAAGSDPEATSTMGTV